ncbi:MAG: AAA family ATPase [Gammaproteobacteria bacterium]|nr:AAA family ATPase [Gammaproteobacteria bacterium]
MKFNLKIKNLGKLTDVNIRIGGFTVFAGPNNTGKSFVSKLLYSLFDGMNANHVAVHFDNLATPLQDAMRMFENSSDPKSDKESNHPLHSLKKKLQEMEQLVKQCSIVNPDYTGELHAINELYPEFVRIANDIGNIYDSIKPNLQSLKVGIPLAILGLRRDTSENDMESMNLAIDGLRAGILDKNPQDLIISGIKHKIQDNLIQNFQVSGLLELKNRKDKNVDVDITDIAEFNIGDTDIGFSVYPTGLEQLQKYSRVIYLESPIHWKLRSALTIAQGYPRFFFSRRELTGVPGYFYDLDRALASQYAGKIAFPDILDKLKTVMGGEIAMSDGESLLFHEGEHKFPLPLTATGVTNLGILALLIERKVIDTGSVIFIDEPEAHLHPAWQVVMAEALFELSRHGVTVVIATHSADILKWLEVQVKNNPDGERLVALNQFLANGSVSDEENFSAKLASIKEELTKPFADLYVEGL